MQNNNVYEYINITNVVNQLHLKKTCTKGCNIYAICPFCQSSKEKNGYLKINTIKNVYMCEKCGLSGSSIDLYANLKYISTKEAFKRLLKETPVLDNIPYTYNNPVKDEYYRDIVYRNFLKMQNLNDLHYKKLKGMNFTDDYIKENQFKSIENNNNKQNIVQVKKDTLKIFDDILEKEKLDKQDLETIIDCIYIYEDKIIIKLKSNIENILDIGNNIGISRQNITAIQKNQNHNDRKFFTQVKRGELCSNVINNGSPFFYS